MIESNIRKLPLYDIMADTLVYCRLQWKKMLLFTGAAYGVGALALFTWTSMFFWPVMLLMYVLWGAFFPYYLGRRPYFDAAAMFNSLVPSTKIVVLSVIIASLFLLLPIIPLFLNISPEFNERYARFLQGNLEDADVLVLFANVLFMLVSPMIAYRPFLAWISALSGRSGSLRFAWGRTKGNYWEFLLIAVLTNLSIGIARWVIWHFGGNDYMTLLWVAPMVIYFNVLAAKAYEFFFLDVE